MPYYLPEEATVSFLDAEILYLRYLIVNEHENETCTCVCDTISNQNTESDIHSEFSLFSLISMLEFKMKHNCLLFHSSLDYLHIAKYSRHMEFFFCC